jgi:hypothetical protein
VLCLFSFLRILQQAMICSDDHIDDTVCSAGCILLMLLERWVYIMVLWGYISKTALSRSMSYVKTSEYVFRFLGSGECWSEGLFGRNKYLKKLHIEGWKLLIRQLRTVSWKSWITKQSWTVNCSSLSKHESWENEGEMATKNDFLHPRVKRYHLPDTTWKKLLIGVYVISIL